MIKIIDTAFWDGRFENPPGSGRYSFAPVDWSKAVAGGWAGGIFKATQGVTITDPLYAAQAAAAKGVGAPYGSYHWLNPSVNAITAAHMFCDVVEANGGYGPRGAWCDAESNPTLVHGPAYFSALGSWLNEVRKRMVAAGSSAPLGIYTRKTFWEPLWLEAGSPAWTKAYPAWLAQYPYDRSIYFDSYYAKVMSGIIVMPIPTCSGLPIVHYHQWTARGKPEDVPGYPLYKKQVDFNICYVPISEPAPAPIPTPTAGLRFRVLATRMNVRSSPSTAGLDVGDVLQGDVVTAEDIGGQDWWIKRGPNEWIAGRTGGVVYLELID